VLKKQRIVRIDQGEGRLEFFEAPTPENGQILDDGVLDKLAAIMPHDRLMELAASYLNGLRARAGRIAAHAAAGNMALLGREAHDLKSTSGSFGALRLQGLGERLETACRDADAAAAAALVAEIVPIVPETLAAVLARHPDIPLDDTATRPS
jgi:HPt (histidine-containing phosphotransfer) domain-containing protein